MNSTTHPITSSGAATTRKDAFPIAAFAVELQRRNRLLFYTTLFHLLLVPVFLAAMLLDERLVLGENPWIKPIKFSLSIATYCAGIAWFTGYLKISRLQFAALNRSIALTMLVEIAVITLQAARGTTSHFNNTTILDSALFSIMGLAIIANTVANIWIFVLFLTNSRISEDIALSPAYLTAVRLALLIFILGALEGGSMLAVQKHTVGAADGGPGIAVLHWSSVGGDLRIAHFFGLHALQIIPLAVFGLERIYGNVRPAVARFIAGLYFAAFNFLYIQAMLGRPLFG